MSKQYITTAIDYPNAAPHMGHVLEKVLADVIARWFRLRGDDVRFQIGTDEHGIKIQQTAKKQEMTPHELVEKNVPYFKDLYAALNISADHFVRTTDQKDHWPTVQALWRKLREVGALEKRSYTGLYCSGCERFVTVKDLIDGKCPDHNIVPQEVIEENWFFKLKDKKEELEKMLSDGTYTIIPDYRKEETLALLESGLEDVSFSRPTSSLTWGIPVPDDEGQVMYVWCDALTNYISTLGLLTDERGAQWWSKDSTVTHVIGKDIARFHALIWPAMLSYAGIRPPNKLLIHGFVTSEGQKMSKSLGNVVEPNEALQKFGGNPDPVRFFLCHEIPVGRDGDFSWKRLEEMYQAKLGNQLGNMLNRALVLLRKDEGLVRVPTTQPITPIADEWVGYAASLDAFEVHAALQRVTNIVSLLNTAFNDTAPWKMKEDANMRIGTLGSFAECLRHIALMLLPFMPDTAYRISKQLNVPYAEQMLAKEFVITDQLKTWGGCTDWNVVGEPSILFAPLEPKVVTD